MWLICDPLVYFAGVAKVLKAMGQHLNIKAHVGAIVSPLHANMVVAHTKTEVAIHTLQTVLKRNRWITNDFATTFYINIATNSWHQVQTVL